jgi:hypothetical protein
LWVWGSSFESRNLGENISIPCSFIIFFSFAITIFSFIYHIFMAGLHSNNTIQRWM